MKKLLIDNCEETSLDDFLLANSEEGVEPLLNEDIESLNEMEIGDILFIGFCEVKRVN